MILVIDDCPRRQAGLRKAFGKTVEAMSFAEAAFALTLWRELPTIYLDCDGVDGERIARRLVETGLHTTAKIRIHSSNVAGAMRMYETLKGTHDVELVNYAEVAV